MPWPGRLPGRPASAGWPRSVSRRSYALHLTARGEAALADVGRVAREHGAALCAALDEDERQLLAELLARIAEEQGLVPGVHPGLARGG